MMVKGRDKEHDGRRGQLRRGHVLLITPARLSNVHRREIELVGPASEVASIDPLPLLGGLADVDGCSAWTGSGCCGHMIAI